MPLQISLRRRGVASDGIAGRFSPMPSQLRSRRRGMPSDGRHWMHACTNVAGPLNHAMDLIAARDKNNLDWNDSEERTYLKTYKRRVRRVMPDELVWEILLRLSPKTLARFKSVCRAWRYIISSPSFISMHLRQSASRNEREPSFLIAPHTSCDMMDLPTSLSMSTDKVAFYHWQQAGQGNACLVHAMDLHGESGFAYCPLHCDGLVLLPTDTKLYVFNPGTGDVLNLPEGQKSMPEGHDWRGCAQAPGLGLDLSTNTYKVAHFFYRSMDYSKRTYNAGMEVFTIGGHGSCWRIVEDPPYPVIMPQAPADFKGSLYWHIARELLQSPLQGILRFDLEEETFGFISHPVLPSDECGLQFIELGGKLCLVQKLPTELVFWTSPSGDNHQWHRVYVINNLPKPCMALRFLGDYYVFLQSGKHIYCHDKATGTVKEVASVDQLRYKNPRTGNLDFVGKDRYFIFIIPYTESLVPLPRAR